MNQPEPPPPPSRRRRVPTVALGLLSIVALVASACSSSPDREEGREERRPEGSTVDAGGLTLVPGGVQQLWVLDRVVAVDLDGSQRDVTETMLAQASEDLGDGVDITDRSRFRPSRALEPQMLDRDGAEIEAVVMTAGVLEAEDDAALAVLATPRDGEWLIDRGYTLRLDLPTAAEVVSGTPLVVDYAHVRYLPVEGADGLGDDVDPLELWQDRAALGAVFYPADVDGELQLMTAEVGVARSSGSDGSDASETDAGAGSRDEEASGQGPGPVVAFASTGRAAAAGTPARSGQGSGDDWADAANDAWNDELVDRVTEEVADQLDIPSDALPLLEGIRDGARSGLDGKCRSTTCVKNLTKEIREGFEKSWEKIEKALEDPEDPEPGGGPDPDPEPPDPTPPPPGWTPRPKPPSTPIDNDPPGNPDGPGGGGLGGGGPGSGSPDPGGPDGPDGPGPDDPGDPGGPDDPGGPGDPGGTGGSGGADGPGGAGGAGSPGRPGGAGSPGSLGGDPPARPGPGASYTDPHMITFDRVHYDLMVVGELTLARSDEMEVQVRYAPVLCGCRASVGSAAVVSDGEHRVQVDRTTPEIVLIDGEPVRLEGSISIGAGTMHLEGRPGEVVVTDDLGNEVKLVFDATWVNAYVTASAEDPTWTGLLGNANGDGDDDFVTRDGQSLGLEPGQAAIEGPFADSWRIDDETSLFEYRAGESTATFTEVTYPAPHPEIDAADLESDRQARQPQAEAVCQLIVTDPHLIDACVSDFATTGSHQVLRDSAHTGFVTGLYERAPSASGGGDAGLGDLGSLPPEAELAEPVAGHVAHGSGLALMRVEVPDGDEARGDLVAIDLTTRAIRWTAPEISIGCKPAVVDGLGVVAQAQVGSPRSGPDGPALVLLSMTDGAELGRLVPEGESHGPCSELMSGGEDVVVVRRYDTVSAHRVDADGTFSAELWRRPQHGTGSPVVIDGRLVLALDEVGTDAKQVVLGLVDVETGEITSEVRLESGDLGSLTPVGQGLVAAKMQAAPPTLALLDASTDELRVRWSVSQPADEGRPPLPGRFARTGDVLTGWTKHSGGRGLIAYDLADGSVAWTHTATSFENNGGAVAGTSGAAYIGPFGGAWAEVVGADGEAIRIIETPPTEGWYGPTVFTQVGDETVLLMGGAEGTGLYFTFLDW